MGKASGFQHYGQLILVTTAANLRSEAARNYLSYLWWIIDPLLHMLVFYLVFGILLKQGTDNFVAFLLTGLIPWLWFNKTISNSMMSIVNGRGLMMQVHLPKIILPTIVICQDMVKESVVLALLIAFLSCYGLSPSLSWIALPALLLTEVILIAACSYLVAAMVPFLPDIRFLVNALLQMLMFCSGVFYDAQIIPAQYHGLFYLNPAASLLRNYRLVLLNNSWPDWDALFSIVSGSALLVLIMFFVIRRLDHIYPRVVI